MIVESKVRSRLRGSLWKSDCVESAEHAPETAMRFKGLKGLPGWGDCGEGRKEIPKIIRDVPRPDVTINQRSL